MYRLTPLLSFVALCLIVLGCGQKSSTAKLAPVKGTITLNGKAMGGGEIRFSVPGQPVKTMPIASGAFSGEASVGKNNVEVVWEKDGPPNPMNPSEKLKVNVVNPQFSGPSSELKADITDKGATDLKFTVTGTGQ